MLPLTAFVLSQFKMPKNSKQVTKNRTETAVFIEKPNRIEPELELVDP